MFEQLIEDCVALPESILDEQLRANELELRRLTAERAVLVGVIEQRGLFADLHRSMGAYLRATTNCSTGTASADRKLARLLTAHPAVGEALLAGRISVDAAMQICRVQSNKRIRELLAVVMPVLLDLAEHTAHHEFAIHISDLISRLDQDGAFTDTKSAVDGRRATVVEVAGMVVVNAHGGDAIQAAQIQAIFDSFVDGEYRRDIETRRAEHGDAADQHPLPLPRSHAQRSFDALLAVFAAAAGSPEASQLPEPVVHVVVDADTAHDTLVHAGIVLPNGDHIDLDDTGNITDEASLFSDLTDELADHPEAFLDRHCETENGSPIHPSVMLRALLTGHVRRVVMDSRGVVIDYGTKQRLFSGLARQAAMLMSRTCEAPGCTTRAGWSQVDHNIEWSNGGTTDQHNTVILCGPDNRLKHRQHLRIRRDQRGRAYTLKPDGTIILPVGEHPPDLTIHEQHEHTRRRIQQLIADHPAASLVPGGRGASPSTRRRRSCARRLA
jgi:hypothetical protein